MPSILSTSLLVFAFLRSIVAFNAYATTNVATYYGGGANQLRLSSYCNSSSIDIIPIGFVTQFQNTGADGYIETNYGNQCGGTGYNGSNLLMDCPYLIEDIPYCQTLGKKILISLGGGATENYYHLSTPAEAQALADFLWQAYGPVNSSYTGPRPFGTTAVDGFDLDLETGASLSNNGENYSLLAQYLRAKFSSDFSKSYYLSGAPQCLTPDANLGSAVIEASLDFIFVQYYNTPQCAAVNYVDPSLFGYSQTSQLSNFEIWNAIAANNSNPDAKWFLGLPGDSSAGDYYLSQGEVDQILQAVQTMSNFGGIMLWDVTAATTNVIDGYAYLDLMKASVLDPYAPPVVVSTTAPASTPLVISTTAPPGPVQTGIASNCDAYHLVVSGDTCSGIVSEFNGTFTLAQLYSWNPAVGSTCADLDLGDYVCVGVSSTTTTTAAPTKTSTVTTYLVSTTAAPGPVQTGMASNCDAYHLVVSGDTCDVIVADLKGAITLAQFYSWNPAVGSTCADLFLGYYVCVGVSATSSTTSTKTPTTSTKSSTTTSKPTSSSTKTSTSSIKIMSSTKISTTSVKTTSSSKTTSTSKTTSSTKASSSTKPISTSKSSSSIKSSSTSKKSTTTSTSSKKTTSTSSLKKTTMSTSLKKSTSTSSEKKTTTSASTKKSTTTSSAKTTTTSTSTKKTTTSASTKKSSTTASSKKTTTTSTSSKKSTTSTSTKKTTTTAKAKRAYAAVAPLGWHGNGHGHGHRHPAQYQVAQFESVALANGAQITARPLVVRAVNSSISSTAAISTTYNAGNVTIPGQPAIETGGAVKMQSTSVFAFASLLLVAMIL